MGDFLRKSSNWLANMQRDHMASPITFTRGADTSTVKAGRARADVDLDDGSDVLTRMEAWVFIVARSELQLNGIQVQPELRDRFTDSGDVFEVVALPGRSHWQWTDGYCNAYRINAKKVISDS